MRFDAYLRFIQERGAGRRWEEMQQGIARLVREYGMLGTPAYQQVGALLYDPVIVIDEVQDLAQVEWSAICRLYFHLTRRAKRSRLVLLGDQNQQVMPTGFRWEEPFELLENKARFFGYDEDRFHPRARMLNAEQPSDQLGPYLVLSNNYRTSEEVAKLANALGKAVANLLFLPDEANEKKDYESRLIDPARTILCSEDVMGDYQRLDANFRKPQVVVAQREVILHAIRRYSQDPDSERRKGGLVFITRNARTLEDDIGAEGVGIACYTPLNCKGLEFTGVNIVDVPRKDFQGRLDFDLAAQWYCSVTRPRVLLALFLTPEEEVYLRRCAWFDQDMCTAMTLITGPNGASVEQCLEILRLTATKNIVSEELAERYLIDFGTFPRVPWRLERAIEIYLELGNEAGANRARWIGARVYEDQQAYLRAIQYYEEVQDWVSCARCYKLEVKRLDALRLNADKNDLLERARDFAEQKEASGSQDAYRIWDELGEYQRAMGVCLGMGDYEQAEREARKISSTDDKRRAQNEVAEKLRGVGRQSWPDAYRIFHEIEEYQQCRSIASELHRDNLSSNGNGIL